MSNAQQQQQWSPNPQMMIQLVTLLQRAQQPDKSSQPGIQEALDGFQRHPEYVCYLVTILCNTDADRYQRQLSGLMLKNFVKKGYGALSPMAKQYVKQMVVRVIGDAHVPVRRTAGIVVSAIVEKEQGFDRWPSLLEGLVSMLREEGNGADGSLRCLCLMCEDCGRLLQDHPSRPLNALIPALVSLLSRPPDSRRLLALRAIHSFIVDMPSAMRNAMEQALQGLFSCANSNDVELLRHVCRTFNTLAELRPAYVTSFINSIANFMLAQTGASDEDVRAEACEFWQVLADQVTWHDVIRSRVPQLLPLLLDNMLISAEEVENIIDIDDVAVPLSDKHIAPWFSKGKRHGGSDSSAADDDNDDDGDGGGDGGGGGDGDSSLQWSLRKAAAASLDAVCGCFSDPLLQVLMPLLKERLQSNKWRVKEAAILALGAAAEGTINGMVPLLPVLCNSLLGILQDAASNHVLVVGSACWTLSRLCSWIIRQPQSDLLDRMVRSLVQLLRSQSRRVQEASCSAIGILAEETWGMSKRVSDHNAVFWPFVMPVLTTLMQVLPRYQGKNLLVLYDTVSNLLEGAPKAKEVQVQLCNVLVPPLMQAWSVCPPDRRQIALVECLVTVCMAVGPAFAPFSQQTIRRVLQMAQAQLQQYSARMNAEQSLMAELRAQRPDSTSLEAQDVILQRLGVAMHDLDYVVVALDVIGAIVDSFQRQSAQALQGVPVVDMLASCMSCPDASVRQASFALVGDLARYCFDQVAPAAPHMIPLLVNNLYGSRPKLCMNACWALGELMDRLPAAVMAPHVPDSVTRLRRVLMKDHDSGLLRNAAITLCRIAQNHSAVVASKMDDSAAYWIEPLSQVKIGPDRDRSHISVLLTLRANLPVALQQLPRVAMLLHSWGDVPLPPPVKAAAVDLLNALKGAPQFQQRWQSIPPEVQAYLTKELR